MSFLIAKTLLNFGNSAFKANQILSKACFPTLFEKNGLLINFQSVRGRKRKGFRIKAEAEKKKRAAQRKKDEKNKPQQGWISPHLRVNKANLNMKSRRYDESALLPLPPDNVYHTEGFRQIAYSLQEAIEMHRETHDPTMYNEPNAVVEAIFECNMLTKKKTKFLAPFSGLLVFPHNFDYKVQRRIVAISKKFEDHEIARNAGAVLAGGTDIIKMIKSKDLTANDFDFIICHSDMLIDLAEVRGILKDHFPNKSKGNFGSDIKALMTKFNESIDYKCQRDDFEPNFGIVEVPFGRLSMDVALLNENLSFVCKKIESHKGKDAPGEFISRILLKSPPSNEQFRLKHWELLEHYEDPYATDVEENVTVSSEQ